MYEYINGSLSGKWTAIEVYYNIIMPYDNLLVSAK